MLPGDAALVIGSVCGLLLAAGIVTTGTQVVRSASKANDHLTRANAIGAAGLDQARGGGETLGNVSAAEARKVAGAAGGAIREPLLRSLEDSVPRGNADDTDDSSRRILAQLNEYYAANISQGNTIFWASLLSMTVGFGIIFAGIVTASTSPTAAIVATIAGVLSQFISATFLVALRSTQQQATTYAQTLADLRSRDLRSADDARSIALGLSLLGEIAGDGATALANQTRAAIATGLIVKDPNAAAVTTMPVPPSTPLDSDAGKRIVRAVGSRIRAQSVAVDETVLAPAEPAADR